MEYGIHGKRKTFNNKLYQAISYHATKSEARTVAKNKRRKGRLARVVKTGKVWSVYVS